jgi:hypothetical protein
VTAQVPSLILEAAWAAIGKYTVYTALLVLAHWGFFVGLAYMMLLETERRQIGASTSKHSAKVARRRDDGGSSCRFGEDISTYSTYSSYSAAGSAEREQATMLSMWLSLLSWVPLADVYASKTAKNVKDMHAGV